ncbi:MAG: sialidase family protein [Spartobacteria bacterium]
MLSALIGVFLALVGFGNFSAQAEEENLGDIKSSNLLVPAGFDCAQLRSLGIDRQENLRAGAIAIYCGEAEGGTPSPAAHYSKFIQQLLAPLAGTTDVDLITGADTGTHITQSETFTAANPDNPNQVMVAYNDSRGVSTNPINISGASYSSDGGNTYTRLTAANGQSPFPNTFGDPVVLYNRPTATWFTVWLDAAAGGQGLGGYKSTTPGDPSPASWTHFAVHNNSADDRESGWADNNPASPFYGRMYVSWNNFNIGGGALFVRYSTDNGLTWNNERQLSTSFFRNVQITGDLATGAVYVASMDEGAGGLTNRTNKLYRSTDGGNTWSNIYNGPSFAGPGRGASGFFATMYNSPTYWRHQGWGQPAALNGVVHYVYDARNTGNGDPANVFYIRSTDGGVTFSAPFQLNTNNDATKAQWQPNLSVATDGTLFSVWYDERDNLGPCQPSNPTKGCYRMWSRKSLDNGVTWLPDEAYSDELSPLPLQPDSSIVSIYVGDYDYSSSVVNQHIHSFVDGRKAVNNASQQDAFVDREPAGGGGGSANLVSAASRLAHGAAGTFNVDMPLTGTSGVEDRDNSGTYQAVFTFDTAVTSGNASIVGGTATAGTPTFSGSEMRVPLTGVTDIQTVTIRVSGVNGGSATANVPFSFLIGDVDASRVVDRPDLNQIRTDRNQPVTGANFRDDIDLSGVVDRPDVQSAKAHRNNAL